MNDHEWHSICFLIEEAWPGEFDHNARKAWRVLLDGFSAEQIAVGLRAMIAKGGTFRPSVAEVVAQIRRDPSAPTFEEAFRLIYGPRGVLRARPPYEGKPLTEQHFAAAITERLEQVHPLVASFAARYGIERLKGLELDHPQYGELNRKQLREAWDRHTEAMEGREVAALAMGRRGELGKLDPIAALGLGRVAIGASNDKESEQ